MTATIATASIRTLTADIESGAEDSHPNMPARITPDSASAPVSPSTNPITAGRRHCCARAMQISDGRAPRASSTPK